MLVAEFLRAFALDKAAAWDPVGLQLGDPMAELDRVGVCHDVTEQVVEASGDLDLLVAYHPLLFKPFTRLVVGPGPTGRAYRLVRQGIGLATVHTAWDAAPGGSADALASAVGLRQSRPFGMIEPTRTKKLITFVPPDDVDHLLAALVEAGAGTIGRYRGCSFRSPGIGSFLPSEGSQPTLGNVGEQTATEESRVEVIVPASAVSAVVAAVLASHPYEEPAFDLVDTVSNAGLIGRVGEFEGDFADLVHQLREGFGPGVRIAAPPSPRAKTVAVLPGSGGSFIDDAARSGAGVFVTGDVSHHQVIEALDRGMAVIDIGHAASERPGVKALLEQAGKMGPTVVDLSFEPIPWYL